MLFKILAGIAASTLYLGYFAPLVIKLRDIPLSIVLLGGVALVAVDFWESLGD